MFRVLAFTLKPVESAVERYRILQYRDLAKQDGIAVDCLSFMGSTYFRWQMSNEHLLLRVLLYPLMLALRLWQVLRLAPKYDAVWLSREMAPFGPPVLEHLLVRLCKRVVFDVDDALHIKYPQGSRLIPRLLRDHEKYRRVAASYGAIVCGNRYLADYYKQYSSNVHVVPTVVDANRYAGVEQAQTELVRIGWIGTPLNRHHLDLVRPAIVRLAQERRFELVVVGLNAPLDWELSSIRYLTWKLEDELTYFSHFDIGIMPLEDSPFTRGKCAFKLIQYMAAGLPVVASPVGANCEVVEQGCNGFLASTQDEWLSKLTLLIDEPHLRRRMGEQGRDLVRRHYSTSAAWPSYSAILRGIQPGSPICAA